MTKKEYEAFRAAKQAGETAGENSEDKPKKKAAVKKVKLK